MKKFLIRGLYFSLLIILYAGIIVLTDPYNYFNINTLIPKEYKEQISAKKNARYWKVIEYANNKSKNIILGDSRSRALKEKDFEKFTSEDYYNLAFGAATLEEIIKTYWYASEVTDLKRVYIGVNFNLYNKYNNKDLVSKAIDGVSPEKYIFEMDNIKALQSIIKAQITGKIPQIGIPDMTREEFWQSQLSGQASKYYSLYKYPDNYYEELKKIADHCKKNNTELIFFIPPTHTDLQDQITKFELDEASQKFKKDLNSLAKTVDFDYPSDLTRNAANFNDPYHVTPEVASTVVEQIVKETYVKLSKNN